MNKIPKSVPVFFKTIEQADDADKRYTKAKLKVFYVGQTADGRLFTQSFSDKVVKTLPLTPVVAFYSTEDEDFKGHNKEQYIYGVVPDTAEMSFEEEEDDKGNKHTYLITDVILYTERKDNISKIANKIIGKQHSLELDPDTLKYKINRDANGKFLNIEFTDGKFIGLSVLGDNETPAFTGSGFFTENKDLQEMSETIQSNFTNFFNLLKNNNGGNIEVFNSEAFFNQLHQNFAKLTMQEFQEKIYAALQSAGIYGYIVENTEDYAIVYHYSEEQDTCIYTKYNLSLSNDEISLGDAVQVKAKYLTEEEIQALSNSVENATATATTSNITDPITDATATATTANINSETAVSTAKCGDSDNKKDKAADNSDDESEDDQNNKNDGIDSKDDDKTKCVSTEGDVSNATQSSQSQDQEKQMGTSTANSSASALSDSERQELEQYRAKEKENLINSYANDLDCDTIKGFMENVAKYSYAELEAQLAIAFRKFKLAHPETTTNNQVTIFSNLTNKDMFNKNYDENNPTDVITKHLNKK